MRRALAALAHARSRPSPKVSARLRRHWRGAGSPARRSRPPGSAALPVTKVWREAEVLPASGVRSVSALTSRNASSGDAERVGADLGDDGIRALADIDRALVQRDAPVAAEADADGRGIGQRGVAAAIPQPAMPTPRRMRPRGVALKASASARARCQCGRKRLEAGLDADAGSEHLAASPSARRRVKRIPQAELQRVDAELARRARR